MTKIKFCAETLNEKRRMKKRLEQLQLLKNSQGQIQSKLNSEPSEYLYIYISVWIRKNIATEFDLSLIIVTQFCPSASFPQGLW